MMKGLKMQINNSKYNSEKAVNMRKELAELQDKGSALQYDLFLVSNEIKKKQQEYLEYLGVVKKESEELKDAKVQ